MSRSPKNLKMKRKSDQRKTKRDLQEEVIRLQDKIRSLQTELMLDDLTGLFNARHLKELLNNCLSDVENTKPALLFIDVDYFKSVNEKHGHQTGGHILNVVGRMISRLIRVDDVAFRYGGDEFVVLVNGGLEGAMLVGERLRKSIEEASFMVNGLHGPDQVRITISVGIRVIQKEDSVQNIIDEADRAMYVAKRRSRNTLVAA